MGAACRRPARTDADGASVHGASGRSWRWSLGDTGGASSEPLVPLRQLDAVSDWNLLLDASKLAGTPNVAPYVMQRYWTKARDGNFHPQEFAEPHVVEVLSRTLAAPPEALRLASAAPAGDAEAPVLGYAFRYMAPGAAPAGSGGSAPPAGVSLLVVAIGSGAQSLDLLAACDVDSRGALAPLPAEWRTADCPPDAAVLTAFLEAARQLERVLLPRVRAHVRGGGPTPRVLLTGHGVGGAVAALLALALATRAPGAVWWAAFGAPRPGDAGFAAAFNASVGLRAAIKQGRDCVPKLPVGARLAAVGEALHLGRDDPFPDLPVMSDLGDHELAKYRALLAAGPPQGGAFGLPPFELETLAPQRALATLANESFRAFQLASRLGDEITAAAGAAVAAVPPPPPLPPLPALGDLLANLPGSSAAPSPANTPRSADAQAGGGFRTNPALLQPPATVPRGASRKVVTKGK